MNASRASRAHVAASALLILIAAGGLGAQRAPAEFVGCYQLNVSAWSEVLLKSVHVGDLRGSAIARSDAIPLNVEWPSAPVTARRIACRDAVSPGALAFAAKVAGCYALDPGPWRSTRVHAGDISTADTPLRFELTAERMEGMEELQRRESPWFHVREIPHANPRNSMFVSWRRIEGRGDRILISETLPIAGVSLELVPRGTDLVGRVVAQTDALVKGEPSTVWRSVRARRVDCTVEPHNPPVA